MKSFSLVLVAVFLAVPPIYAATEIEGGGGSFILPISPPGSFRITTNPGELSHSRCISSNNPQYCEGNQYSYDLAGSGTPVAVANGSLRYVYDPIGGGNCLVLDIDSSPYSALYCHLANSAESYNNKRVNAGDQVSSIGVPGIDRVGAESGSHLHFSLIKKGVSPWTGVNTAGVIAFSGLQGYNPNAAGGGPVYTKVNPINLGEIGVTVTNFYNYSLAIGGVLALLIIVYGGVLYVLSAGNASRQTDAKEWIKAAIFGLALLLLSYLILNTINPCFVGRATCA